MESVMTTDNPKWPLFVDLLDKALEHGCPHDHRFTVMALSNFEGIDVEASLQWIKDHGGCCCDCEVLMNVEGQRLDLAILRGEAPVPDFWTADTLRNMKRMHGITDQYNPRSQYHRSRFWRHGGLLLG